MLYDLYKFFKSKLLIWKVVFNFYIFRKIREDYLFMFGISFYFLKSFFVFVILYILRK